MPVTVVQIGIMRMRVHQGPVRVLMAARLDTVPAAVVRMLMMLVVAVHVSMGKAPVPMRMFMSFVNVQPHANGHQCCCGPE
jgi:hypothetical protein